MGCIEIRPVVHLCICQGRLTLTWDVLKFFGIEYPLLYFKRLTLTWDVLK